MWCSTGHDLAHGCWAQGFSTQRTLASPTFGSSTPATASRGNGGQQQPLPPMDAEPTMVHTAAVCVRRCSCCLRASRALCHRRMERQSMMMPLSFSSNCGGPMAARDAIPQIVCRWVPGSGSCGRDHTTTTNYVVYADGRQWVFDDRPFIVLTETKFSLRCIPVWIGTVLTGLGSKKNTCDNVLTMTSTVPW